MRVLTKDELKIKDELMKRYIKEGAVFLHPTDTIYGLGCDSSNRNAVRKIRKMKKRPTQPFSVIAPSKKWIKENCVVTKEAQKWITKLPGPYTLILKLKNKNCVAKEVNPGLDTLGVRIPKHWFTDFVKKIGFPLVTTSANCAGRNFMTSVDDIDTRIKSKLDFMVYEGEKKGIPSKIIDLSKESVEVRKR